MPLFAKRNPKTFSGYARGLAALADAWQAIPDDRRQAIAHNLHVIKQALAGIQVNTTPEDRAQIVAGAKLLLNHLIMDVIKGSGFDRITAKITASGEELLGSYPAMVNLHSQLVGILQKVNNAKQG